MATRLSLPNVKGGEETIAFDKDDDDTLDFVCAAANMRSVIYGIPSKTRWEVKGAICVSSIIDVASLPVSLHFFAPNVTFNQKWPVTLSPRSRQLTR